MVLVFFEFQKLFDDAMEYKIRLQFLCISYIGICVVRIGFSDFIIIKFIANPYPPPKKKVTFIHCIIPCNNIDVSTPVLLQKRVLTVNIHANKVFNYTFRWYIRTEYKFHMCVLHCIIKRWTKEFLFY